MQCMGVLVDIDSGNGLLPDGTKPLPKPMLTFFSLDPPEQTALEFE